MTKLFPLTAYWLGLLGLSGMALGLRFWGLGRFNQLVFDEIYYVPFALGYLTNTPSFDAHPPMGKYLIALGIWLGQGPATWFHWPTVAVDTTFLSPLSFRAMNALVGATLPILVAALAYALSHRYALARRERFSLLAAALMGMEGLTLVESRLALINLYWLWLGLLGQTCWLIASARPQGERLGGRASSVPIIHWVAKLSANPTPWRMAAGIALGAAINVKWNGAGFWLGLLLWEGWLYGAPSGISSRAPAENSNGDGEQEVQQQTPRSPIKAGSDAKPLLSGAIYLGLLPLVTYSLLWLPHLALTEESFGGIHQRLWQAHQTIGTGDQPHPYCSAWFTWPWMLRPIAYFHEAHFHASLGNVEVPTMMAPYRAYGDTVMTIQAMGNPVLWWLATAAVVALGLGWLSRRRKATVEAFLVINYLANWLPWMLVNRCTFLYHALGMVAFSTLALAWLLSGWLGDRRRSYRLLAGAMLGLIALSFYFWLPLFMGWPLTPTALQRRWWLPTWI